MSSSGSPTQPHPFRGRIGPDASSGYYPAPHRYQLYLSLSCPGCLGIAITYDLLRLHDRVELTLLPAVPDDAGGYEVLRPAYEATAHRCAGPAAVPALVDRWTGRVVSNHAPHILRDLANRFRADGPELFPAGLDGAIERVVRCCDQRIGEAAQRAGQASPRARQSPNGQSPNGQYAPNGQQGRPAPGAPEAEDHESGGRASALESLLAGLDAMEEALADGGPFVLGTELTAADVHLWTTLVQLDTIHRWHLDAEAVHRIAARRHVWGYARRLLRQPAFRGRLRTDDIASRHHHHCRGQEAAGAAVQIIDWATPDLPAPVRRPH
ncbi:glutathione S-transferase C-terminal domain-containing protein [Streptomyces sp. B6B3]|uniref:glutathione S-transferase C-terminal domain-containing protein n=1 Tax=Streptomyces sp. B6B3 TaxID=3153570 RepID=UPI00325DA0CC